jgi:hypothetical protein
VQQIEKKENGMTASDSKCKVIMPPEEYDFKQPPEPPVVFLAGAIDMGEADDWQKEVIDSLKDVPCVILNPRRKDWDKSWKQDIENDKFREQVEWELKGLEQCSLIALCLTKDSKAPISLLEMGLHISDGRMIVHCPEGFYRKGNVDIVCEKYGVPVLQDFEDFKMEVKRRLNESVVRKPLLASDRMAWRIMAREFVIRMKEVRVASNMSASKKVVCPDCGQMVGVGLVHGGGSRYHFITHVDRKGGHCKGSGWEIPRNPDKEEWGKQERVSADRIDDPMAGEKLTSLFLALQSWATRKVTSLPAGAPVALQILDGLNDVETALKGKMGLRGREAVIALLKAMKGCFTMDAPPIPALIRRYGVDAIRECAGHYFASVEAGMGDTHPFGSPLRGRPDYGERDGEVGEKYGLKLPSEGIMTSGDKNMNNWNYKKLHSTTYRGSQKDWHQYEKDGHEIVFSNDNGDDEQTEVLVDGKAWGKFRLDHHLFSHVDFGYGDKKPVGLEKVADYILAKVVEKNMEGYTAGSNHKDFATKKEALKFLEDNALMSVGWKEGSQEKVAIYWNGKVNISNAGEKKYWMKHATDTLRVRVITDRIVAMAKEFTGSDRWDGEIQSQHMRFQWVDGRERQYRLTEMPMPGKKRLRVRSGGFPPWLGGSQKREYGFLLMANVASHIKASMTYEQAASEIDRQMKELVAESNGKSSEPKPEKDLISGPWETLVFYLEVEPADMKPFVAEAKDFKVSIGWDKFEAYDPSSDFEQSDPSYTKYQSKSPTAARKMYKVLNADPDALKNLSWRDFSGWLRKNGISYDSHMSQWHLIHFFFIFGPFVEGFEK